MSQLRSALERYVHMRQGLGYKYEGPACRLSDFVGFMEARSAKTITAALAMEWVTHTGAAAKLGDSPDRRALLRAPRCTS